MTECPSCGSPDPALHPVADGAPESLIGSAVDHTEDCPDVFHSAVDQS